MESTTATKGSRVRGEARPGPHVRRGRIAPLFAIAIATLGLVLGGCNDSASPPPVPRLEVGSARRDITPDATNAPPEGRVYLGGYGLGPSRLSTGVLAPISVRAMVIHNGRTGVAFVENETQGMFAAYRNGAFGLTDAARLVEEATGGAIPREGVFTSSDHSHAGPDAVGVWGGVPETYLAFIRDQIVAAVVEAWQSRRPAELWVGSADATDLIRSQFSKPPNDVIDGELRVLLATEPGGDPARPIAAMLNYAAHATVMGSGNTKVSADWPGPVATALERELGIETAVVMVADVGRTQPLDGDVPGDTDEEKLAGYAARVEERALRAVASARRRAGTEIDSAWLFLREKYGNPFLTLQFLGSLILRDDRSPWLEEDRIGTLVGAARVGDLFFAALPGEGYPAIHLLAEQAIPADMKGFTFGLANDQLGYLIAPESGYPDVAAAAPDNDNALFNVSPRIGEHVGCTVLDATRAIGVEVSVAPPECERYADEDHSLPF